MHLFLKGIALTAAVALPLIVVGQERREEPNRTQSTESSRYEDSAHKVHEWNAREDESYRRYLQDHHKKYHDLAKASKKEQNDYWKWRQNHADDNRR